MFEKQAIVHFQVLKTVETTPNKPTVRFDLSSKLWKQRKRADGRRRQKREENERGDRGGSRLHGSV